MLSSQLATELEVTQKIPTLIEDISFVEDHCLWRKYKHFHGFKTNELTAKRYEYFKVGKTFGLETKRLICQCQGHLFYFNEIKDEDYLGFCDLMNTYVQWISIHQNRYLLILSNGIESTLFYFNQPSFWQQQGEEIAKYSIQLDFQLKYQILTLLGEGSFSQVQKVKSKKTGQFYAAKIISKQDKKGISTKTMVESQRKILHEMSDEKGVSNYYQFFETNNSYIIILDYIQGQSLMEILKKQHQLSLGKLKMLFFDILSVIKECHSRNIIHRDIKPHNIIVSPNDFQPTLIDFGLALITNKQMQSHNYYKCGTKGYTAPQVLQTDSVYYKSYGYKCDIFSFGIVAHMLLMGYNPVQGQPYQLNHNTPIQFKQTQIKQKYGESCLIFLQKMMAPNPKQRYTAAQALKSCFLKDCQDRQLSTSTMQSCCPPLHQGQI